MSSGEPRPRGVVLRSLIAAGLFLGAVLPGWVMAELVENWTGWTLVGWVLSSVWTACIATALAPRTSLRRRDVAFAAVPVLGWYLVCVLAWRTALLPLRDWEPRPDELWRARWLTGPEYAGLWRADPVRAPADAGRAAPRRRGTGRHPGASRQESRPAARPVGRDGGRPAARTDSRALGRR
jgi:hypothetical protein